ncbi:MAG TPA: YkgJ family cysteine cluster protein [Anaerolineae bacterium]|nr:YkgJ family cysteine cluster protein [Anaerolineae bacterium]
MDCRIGCGACCVELSISSPIPGMPNGKPAGMRCVQLTIDNRCLIFGQPERPSVCNNLRPSLEMCGTSDDHAFAYLAWLEQITRPASDNHLHDEIHTKTS